MLKGIGGVIALVMLVACVAIFLLAAASDENIEEMKTELGEVGTGLGALIMASMLVFIWLLLPKIVFEVLRRL